VPQRGRERAQLRSSEQIALELVGSALELGRRFEAIGEPMHRAGEMRPRLVVGVVAGVADEGANALEETVEDAVVDRVREPPGRFSVEASRQRLTVLLEKVVELPDDGVEQLEVATLGGEGAQSLGAELRQGHPLDGPAALL